MIGASVSSIWTYRDSWNWRVGEGGGHLVSGCLNLVVHERMDVLTPPTREIKNPKDVVSGQLSMYKSDIQMFINTYCG
jgi:hypothetical protein